MNAHWDASSRFIDLSANAQTGSFAIRQWLSVGLLLAIPTVLALAIQLSTYPNHDVAWVLWGAREMMHGAEYGRDIIEPNPPLAWYLSMPTNLIAEALGVPLDAPFKVMVTLAGVVSAASLIWLRPMRMTVGQSAVLAAVAVVGLVTLMGREFGQRDPLTTIMALPYLALSARRFEGDPMPGVFARVLIGLIAGVGFALKPYFLIVPLLIEAILWVGSKKPQPLFRSENVTAAAFILAYGGWVILFEQPYINDIVPLVREIYWSFDRPMAEVIWPLLPLMLGTAACAYLSVKKRDGLGLMLSAAFVGFTFSVLMQHKAYFYHVLPVRTVSLLLAFYVVLDVRQDRKYRIAALGLVAVFFMLWAAVFEQWWSRARPGGELYREIGQINHSIARHAAGGGYFVITIRTYPNFPAGIYAPSQYASRTNAQWFIPAVAQLRAKGLPAGPIEQQARDFVLRDLETRPELVLLDTDSRGHTRGPRNFDILKFYKEDALFRSAWAPYREIERIGQFRQFVRVKPRGRVSAQEGAGQ